MKKISLYAFLVLLFFVLVSSCKKYPDGPAITIYTKVARLEGSWVVESATLNDKDVTDSLYTKKNYVEVYDKDGNYSYRMTGLIGSGKYSFQSDGMNMKYTDYNTGYSSKIAVILKLKKHAYWYYYTSPGGKMEIHLKPFS